MTTTTTTIDLQDRIDEIQQELQELRDVIGRHESLAEEDVGEQSAAQLLEDIYADTSYETAVNVEELESQGRPREYILNRDYDDLKKDEREWEKKREDVQSCIDEWGGSEITISEFDAGRQATRNKEFMQDLQNQGINDARVGIDSLQLRTVQVGVVEAPPETPAKPQEWPPHVAEWVYERIDNLNTYGEESIEDFTVWGSEATDGSQSS